MKAVVIQRFGAPDGMAVLEVPDPAPGDGQVLVATEAIGVGGVDVMIRSGAYAEYGFRPGHIPGGEIAGTVAAVGAGVDRSWIGRRVWAFAGVGGGYAELAVAAADTLVPLPAGVSAVDAVTVGGSGTVAHFALRHARFAPGESVLVRGASGGLGVMAVQLARRDGAGAVAVTVSSAERGEQLRELGATHVLDRGGEGGPDAPQRFDVVIDIVAGASMPDFLRRLNPNGRMVVVGTVGGPPPADFGTAMFAAFQQSLSFATFSANTISMAARGAVTAGLLAAIGDGGIRPVLHRVLPLEEAVTAHRMMDAGEVFGRVALTVGNAG
jgi:NADPH:quinone reductase-like Zn-dependent oxidoreductase